MVVSKCLCDHTKMRNVLADRTHRRSIADRSMIAHLSSVYCSPHRLTHRLITYCIVTHAASELGVSVSHRLEGRASTCRARSRMSRVARRRGSNALSELGPRQRAASARAPLRAAAIGGGAPGDGLERLTQSRAGPRRIEPHARRATRAQVTCSVHSDAHRAPSCAADGAPVVSTASRRKRWTNEVAARAAARICRSGV